MFGTTYQRISDLPSTPAVARDPLFAPHGDPIPAPDPATGLRHYESRDYVDMDDGTTIRVTHDLATGEWRERPPDLRVAHGPALHWNVAANTWRSGSPSRSAAGSSPGVTHRSSRIDPLWDISRYTLPVSTPPASGPAPLGLKPVMIGSERYFMDVHYGDLSGAAPHATADIHSVNSSGKRNKVGRVEHDGLYRLNNQRHYLPVGTDFCPVEFDSARMRWKITGPQGSKLPDILIDMGSAPDKWVPMLAVDQVVEVFQSARRIKGYTGLVGPVDLVGSSLDKQVYGYMQGYLRHIIGFCDLSIRNAPVAHKGELIDAYIWANGYPYDQLMSIYNALESGQPIPPGMPMFDAFQGLGTVRCSRDGNFSVGRISSQMQLHYPDRVRSVAEEALLAEWKKSSADRDNKKKGELNEQMYETRLMEDGYTRLTGGTYGEGQNGFDRVLVGPAGHVYVLEAKHVSKAASGEPGNASLFGMATARQMTDKWVHKVLKLAPSNTPAAKAVSAAMLNGQLFKVLGTTTEDGKLIMFKIDMSPVDF